MPAMLALAAPMQSCEYRPAHDNTDQQKMIDTGNCRKYINKNIGRIKRAFKWGVSKELVPIHVFQALATVAGLRKGKTEARETAPILPIDDETIKYF